MELVRNTEIGSDVDHTAKIMFEQTTQHGMAEVANLKSLLQTIEENAAALSAGGNNPKLQAELAELKQKQKVPGFMNKGSLKKLSGRQSLFENQFSLISSFSLQ